MDLFDIAIARKLSGGGGGGGGDSDFSTAQVTISVAIGAHPRGAVPFLWEDGIPALCVTDLSGLISTTETYTIPLYKGECDIIIENATVTVTGDIEEEGTSYYITGNGTINIESA